jgi:hypothetical protein
MASLIAGSRRSGRRVAPLVGLAMALAAPTAGATSPAEVALAQRFFDDARTLFGAGNFHEACAKFAASQKLDPREGTLMNLAICHEKEGKSASAWTEFNDAKAGARAVGHADIDKFASEHIARLTPSLSYLRITVSPEAHARGLTLKLDDANIQEVAWGTDVPIDPGPHTLQAIAPERVSWETKETVGQSGDHKVIDVPVLRVAAGVPVTVVPAAAREPGTAQPATPSDGRKTAGFVIGGVGIASLGVGAAFGIEAISERHQVNTCTGASCGANAQSINDEGVRNAWVSDFTIGAGLVGLAVGTIMVLMSPPGGKTSTEAAGASSSFVLVGRGAAFATTF